MAQDDAIAVLVGCCAAFLLRKRTSCGADHAIWISKSEVQTANNVNGGVSTFAPAWGCGSAENKAGCLAQEEGRNGALDAVFGAYVKTFQKCCAIQTCCGVTAIDGLSPLAVL